MKLKKKFFIILSILLIIFILLIATLIIINKLELNENSYYETYIGTIEKIDDDRIDVSVLEVKGIGFSDNSESVEIFDKSGNLAIKSELSVNDVIFIKERVWNGNDTKFEYCLREGRVTDIEIRDNQSKYILINYLVPKECMIDKNNIKVIKNNNMNSINYSDLKDGDKVYILNKTNKDDEIMLDGSGEVVLPVAPNTISLKNVKLLQVLNK